MLHIIHDSIRKFELENLQCEEDIIILLEQVINQQNDLLHRWRLDNELYQYEEDKLRLYDSIEYLELLKKLLKELI